MVRPMSFAAKIAVPALVLALAACAAPAPPPPAPAPRPAPPPVVAPPPPGDWRDAPRTPGDWRYGPTATGSAATFADGLVSLSCNRAGRTVTLARAGNSPAAVPLTVRTTSLERTFNATPVAGATPALAVSFTANDPLLDAMAFSRGNLAIEVNGLPTLYVPAWSEIGRVVEDCRRPGRQNGG